MRTVDSLRVRDLLGVMADARRRLQLLAELPREEFLVDFRNTESAKYLLIVAIESAIDVCNHIVSRSGGRAPSDYADCFTILGDLGVIEKVLASRMRRMARFRNLIVHLYWQVDDAQVWSILQNDLNDLDEYKIQVATWVGAL